MAVETLISADSFVGADSATPREIGFPIMDPAHLLVAIDGEPLTLNSEYSIGGDYVAGLGIITPEEPWPAGKTITYKRQTDMVQRARLPAGQPLPSRDIEQQLDRQTLVQQETGETLSRAAVIPQEGTAEGHIPVVRNGAFAFEPAADVQQEVVDAAVDNANQAADTALTAAANVRAGVFPLLVTQDNQTLFTLPVVAAVRPRMEIAGVGTELFTWSEDTPTLILFDNGVKLGQEVVAILGQASLQPAVEAQNVVGLAATLDPRAYTIPTFADIATTLVPAPVKVFRTLGYHQVGDGGDATFLRVASQPDHDGKGQSYGGQWWEHADPVVCVLSLGANGTSGDGARIQSAIDSALARGVRQVFAPSLPGFLAYAIDQIVQNDGVRLYGDGQTTFRRIGQGNCFRSGSVLVPGGVGITSDVAKFARTVPVPAGHGLVKGDRCIIYDNDLIRVNSPARKAQFVTVRNVTGPVVTLSGPLRHSFAVASGAKLQKVNLTQDVIYEGFRILMDPTVIPPGSNVPYDGFQNEAIRLLFCERAKIRNVLIRDNPAAAVTLLGCLLCDIDVEGENLGSAENDDDGTRTDGALGGYGYLVNERCLNFGNNINVRGIHVRHAYSTTAEFPQVYHFGMPFATLVNGLAVETFEAGFDTHETGDMITFGLVRIFGGDAYGLQNRCKRTSVGTLVAYQTAGPALYHYGAGVGPNAAGDEASVGEVFAVETNIGPARSVHNNQDWTVDGAVRDQGSENVLRSAHILRSGGPLISTNGATIRPTFERVIGTDPCQLAPGGARYAALLNQTGDDMPVINGMTVRSTDGKVIDLVRATGAMVMPLLKDIWGTGHSGQNFSSAAGGARRFLQGGYGLRSLSVGFRQTLTIAADTIDVRGVIGTLFQLAAEGGGATDNLSNITGGEEGDVINLTALAGSTITLIHGGTLLLAGGANLTISAGDIVTLIYTIGGAWREPK